MMVDWTKMVAMKVVKKQTEDIFESITNRIPDEFDMSCSLKEKQGDDNVSGDNWNKQVILRFRKTKFGANWVQIRYIYIYIFTCYFLNAYP